LICIKSAAIACAEKPKVARFAPTPGPFLAGRLTLVKLDWGFLPPPAGLIDFNQIATLASAA